MSGDYISREELHKQIASAYITAERCGFDLGKDVVLLAIKQQPAADVVEVVHASWVWNPDGMDWGIGAWVCGKCKSRPETWWNTVQECHPLRCSGSHYCGNCGAKMDGGQDK